MVKNHENGYVVKISNVHDFASEVKKIIHDEERRKKMAKNSKRRSANYKHATIKTILAKIYEER